jgi:NCS1 family nucleobase:cation symporter-1
MLSELSLNIVTNGFAGGMDLAGVFPKYIDIKRGAILTALLSWCVQPWEFYNTSSTFLAVMSSFGVIVTPIFAIVVADFTLIRKQRLPLNDLYTTSKDGKFYFTYGVNWRGIFVFVATVTPGLPGIATYVQPSIVLKTDIVNYFYGSIIFSFFVPLILYYIIAKYIFPIRDVDQYEAVDTYNAFTEKECIELQIIPGDGIHEEVITLEDLSKESKSSGLIEETHSKGAQSSINEV